jgi:hypothetical protein
MKQRYWFHTKPYGWGWGLPATWEGWCVMGTYLVFLVAAAILVPPQRLPWWFTSTVTAVTVILVAVAWKTGEPPHWRRGKDM